MIRRVNQVSNYSGCFNLFPHTLHTPIKAEIEVTFMVPDHRKLLNTAIELLVDRVDIDFLMEVKQ